MHVCIIPVKDFKNAKERLAGLLSPEERARLAQAMYQDVLDVVMRGASAERQVLVISANRAALDMAERRGAMVYEEPDPRGQSAAVDLAAQITRRLGGTALLSLPIDIPLITDADLKALWSRFADFERIHDAGASLALMTPARDARGTNALLRRPPDSVSCHFGVDSLSQHIREATERGVAYDLYENPRLALDIDTPDDLAAFLSHARVRSVGEATRSYQELMAMNILQRVS